MPLKINSEIGKLRSVLIHSPDAGVGLVVPSKTRDWLYDDIVALPAARREYDVFKQVLLAFVDPEALSRWFTTEDDQRSHAIPGHPSFVDSPYVLELQQLLSDILVDQVTRQRLIAMICGLEECSVETELMLVEERPDQVVKTLFTGMLRGKAGEMSQIFPPIPNAVFTRDLGAVLGSTLFLAKFALASRARESLISRYLATSVLGKFPLGRFDEVSNSREYFLAPRHERNSLAATLEGGDVMMLSPRHALIGCSERTSAFAVKQLVEKLLHETTTEVSTVSVVDLPKQRASMHLDTILTQIREDLWVLFDLEGVGSNVSIREYRLRGASVEDQSIESLEDMIRGFSVQQLGIRCVDIVQCGGNVFPHSEREQWTDGCNILALKPGVALAYDRNEETNRAIEDIGIPTVRAEEMLADLKQAWLDDPDGNVSAIESKLPEQAIITIPSSELSRGRGGPHCMAMPLNRDEAW